MKKVFLAAAGVALLMLLLAVASGAALASPQASVPSVSLQEQPAVESPAVESLANVIEAQPAVKEIERAAEQVVEEIKVDAEGDDDPEGEHDERGCGCEEGCVGHAEGSMWSVKIDAAAQFLGLTPEEIAAQVGAGKHLYEIAEERGADVEAFKEAVHAAVAAAGGCGCGSY